ncbi:MAG: CsgG/HfaB family protein [Gammaproteobacteria bacterium]
MKKPLAILLLLFSFVSAQETIAVIEFEGKGISQVEASALSDELEIHLSNFGGYTVVERGKMEEVLEEQGFQQSGCVSEECAVEVGKMLGTKVIVVGSISKVRSTFSVNSKIVDVQTGGITRTASYKAGKVFFCCEGCKADFEDASAKFAVAANFQLVASG